MITNGTSCNITHDVIVGEQVAFRTGEIVIVEGVSPNPERPEYKYVVTSNTLKRKFQLSDSDLKQTAQAFTPMPPPITPYAQVPLPKQSGHGKYVAVGIVALVLLIALIAGISQVGNKSSNTSESLPAAAETQNTSSSPSSEGVTAPPTTQAPVQTPTPAATGDWKTVIDVSGNADKRTAPFYLGAGQQKLLYNVVSYTMPVFAVYVMAEGHSTETEGGIPEVMATDPGPGDTFLVKEPGNYYLEVSAANCNWQVTIQQKQ